MELSGVEGPAGSDKVTAVPSVPEVVDERTEAEKRFEQKTAAQEQERLRAAAAATYRDQVDVRAALPALFAYA